MADSILIQVKGLTDGDAALAIATEKINSVDYTIKFAKATVDADITIDNTAKTITITKKDAPTDDDALKAAISAVKIGGTSTAPTIDDANGKAIDCSGLDFAALTDGNGQCTEITLPTPTPTAKTILDQVKGLTDGEVEVEVAKVAIDSNNYDVKFKLDSSASESISGNVITIVRAAAPKDEGELEGIINALYVKKDGSGGYTIGTDTTDAVKLSCASTLFTEKTVGQCDAVTTPTPTPPATTILAQVLALKDGASLAIATEKINGVDYTIEVAKLAIGGTESTVIDNAAKTITISKLDWSTATLNSDALKAAIAEAKIGGTSATPTIDDANGKAIDCSGLDFAALTDGNGQCTEITLPTPTPTAKTILDQVKGLTDGDAALAIATEKINSVDYAIKAAKLAAGGTEGTAIDNTAKTITISKLDWSSSTSNSDALKAAISAVKIGGTVDKLTIDAAAGTASMCYADFAKVTDAAGANCVNILFASKGYTDVATSVLKNNAKITNTDNLKTLIKAVLIADTSNALTAASIVSKITASKANDEVNNAAKALCPAAGLTKIDADGFKTCVATAFKGYVTMNKILTNLPNKATGVLKSDDDGTKFVDFESGLKDAAFASGQFYFDFTTTICAARPFISGMEIPSTNVGTCLDQVNTAAYVLLDADAKCGNANKADLTDCYKAIADTGLKALYTATPDDLLVDFSANYPDVLDN